MIAQSLAPEFAHEMATTRRVLERLPGEKFGWKPHERAWTVRQLATHVATVPFWASMTMQVAELDLGGPFPPPPEVETTEQLLALFDANVAGAKTAIEGGSDADYMTPWTLKTGDKTHFTMPRIGVMRSMVMNHLIHHRGQLAVYLRLLDLPVPSIYGPSADEGTM